MELLLQYLKLTSSRGVIAHFRTSYMLHLRSWGKCSLFLCRQTVFYLLMKLVHIWFDILVRLLTWGYAYYNYFIKHVEVTVPFQLCTWGYVDNIFKIFWQNYIVVHIFIGCLNIICACTYYYHFPNTPDSLELWFFLQHLKIFSKYTTPLWIRPHFPASCGFFILQLEFLPLF